MASTLAVAVVNFASAALVERNLAATLRTAPETTAYVVDNFSSASERARIASVCDREGWTLLAPEENLGFGGGSNLAMTRAFADGATDVLLVNPDAWLDAGSIAALRGAVANRMVLASPIVKTPDGRVWFGGADLYLEDGATRGRKHRDRFPGAERVEWLSGACLWVTREIFEATGGFTPEYFLYWEDVDFSYRVLQAGGTLAVVEDAVAWHDEGATHRAHAQRSEAKSETYYYYNVRNRLLFAARNLTAADARRWIKSAPRSAREILLRGGRRQFLRPVVPLRAAWRGLRDGRKLARTAFPRR